MDTTDHGSNMPPKKKRKKNVTAGNTDRKVQTRQSSPEQSTTQASPHPSKWSHTNMEITVEHADPDVVVAESNGEEEEGNGEEEEEILPVESPRRGMEDGKSTTSKSDPNHMLNEACRSGNVEMIQELLSSGADINNRSKSGLTPVLIAVWKGNRLLFDLLIGQGCDLSVKLDNGNNILHVACFGGNNDIVRFLVTNKVIDIESKGLNGQTPVMKAVIGGCKKVFDELVDLGCNVFGVDDDRNNILHLACWGGNGDIVDYLIFHNIAGIESRGEDNKTPIMFASQKGHKTVFDFLVHKGCDLSVLDDDDNPVLHVACWSDNDEIVQYLLANKIADIKSKGEWGRTPVMLAAACGRKKVFDFLVGEGCDLSGVDHYDNNILHLASFSDNVGIMRYLLDHGIAHIDSKGEVGRTPIIIAAQGGHKKVFGLLVKRGCDLSGVDDTGNNILHLACMSDSTDIVQYLLTHNIAGIDSKGEYGATPVMFAAENGRKHVFDLLVSRGCDLSVLDVDNDSVLNTACFGDSVDIVDYIIRQNISNIEDKGDHDCTPVMNAAEKGQKKIFDFLITKGCDLSGIDSGSNNILHLACFGNNIEIIEYIINNGIADIESKREDGTTSVILAAERGNRKAFDFLVSKECDLSVVDEDGINVLHAACCSDNVEIVQYLITNNVADLESRGEDGKTPVMFAAAKGQRKVFDLLVREGCDLSTLNEDGENILHLACISDSVKIVDFLIAHNIVDIESRDESGKTPVMFAAENGQKRVFDLLINKGCDLSVVDHANNGILHHACQNQNLKIVEFLIDQNIADLNGKGALDRTPIMFAVEHGKKKVFDLLVNKGCDLSSVDRDDKNILHIATMGGNVDIVQWILSDGRIDINSRTWLSQTPLMLARKYKIKGVISLLEARGGV